MPNIQKYTIGSGTTDFSTLEAWWAAQIAGGSGNLIDRDTVVIAELQAGETTISDNHLLMNADDATTDERRYFVIRAAAGAEFKGDFQQAGLAKVLCQGFNSDTASIRCQVPFTRFENFLIEPDQSAISGTFPYRVVGNWANIVAGHTAIDITSGLLDGLGIQKFYSLGTEDNDYLLAKGIQATLNSTIRNCFVNDIYTRLQTSAPFGPLYTTSCRSIGIDYDRSVYLQNNTVGNITAYNNQASPSKDVSELSEAVAFYLNTTSAVPATTVRYWVCEGCNHGYASHICPELSYSDAFDMTESDQCVGSGGQEPDFVVQMTCYAKVIFSGAIDRFACQASNYNGIYELPALSSGDNDTINTEIIPGNDMTISWGEENFLSYVSGTSCAGLGRMQFGFTYDGMDYFTHFRFGACDTSNGYNWTKNIGSNQPNCQLFTYTFTSGDITNSLGSCQGGASAGDGFHSAIITVQSPFLTPSGTVSTNPSNALDNRNNIGFNVFASGTGTFMSGVLV